MKSGFTTGPRGYVSIFFNVKDCEFRLSISETRLHEPGGLALVDAWLRFLANIPGGLIPLSEIDVIWDQIAMEYGAAERPRRHLF